MRERVGIVKIHYFSGRIDDVEYRDQGPRMILESHSDEAIAKLPPLPEGNFYAFHALRLANEYEINDLGRRRSVA